MKQIFLVVSLAMLGIGTVSTAQVSPHASVATRGADGNTFASPADVRYQPSLNEQDRQADMFSSDWRESLSLAECGSLVLRDILTRGSNLNPPQRGAVLEIANLGTAAATPAK